MIPMHTSNGSSKEESILMPDKLNFKTKDVIQDKFSSEPLKNTLMLSKQLNSSKPTLSPPLKDKPVPNSSKSKMPPRNFQLTNIFSMNKPSQNSTNSLMQSTPHPQNGTPQLMITKKVPSKLKQVSTKDPKDTSSVEV
jgi:hypothetical protein